MQTNWNQVCNDYYRDGFNLAQRMKEYRDAHLLFLHDRRIPATNNLAEVLSSSVIA